jgi:hypothetical protein
MPIATAQERLQATLGSLLVVNATQAERIEQLEAQIVLLTKEEKKLEA